MRECRTCGQYKKDEDFPKQVKHGFRGTAAFSYRKDCKSCTAEAAREYRKTYVRKSESRKDVDKLGYSACSARVSDARMRARKSKCPFNLDTNWAYDKLQAQNYTCAVTGRRMSLEKDDMNVLSLDKILPSEGYTKDNTQWVIWAANRAKGDLSMLEFVEMCRDIVRCNDYPEREYSQAAGSALPTSVG